MSLSLASLPSMHKEKLLKINEAFSKVEFVWFLVLIKFISTKLLSIDEFSVFDLLICGFWLFLIQVYIVPLLIPCDLASFDIIQPGTKASASIKVFCLDEFG